MNQTQSTISPANRLGLDYTEEARRFAKLTYPIIDVHLHINGLEASKIFKRAADLYGVERFFSLTAFENVANVQTVLGDCVEFIAVPNFRSEDRKNEMGEGFLKRVEDFHSIGSRLVKFWVAPRGIDFATEMGEPDFLKLDQPHRIAAMELATELDMMFMVHVADPDTWFATKYADASVYGTKRQQYGSLEILLDRFTQPWIAAHMGGWPEDLEFLTGLLDRHPNLHLDSSATKWMVRELSKHSRSELVAFLTRFKGRILFGSDIVTSDDHLTSSDADAHEMMRKASSAEEAFDLYASRYWALRTMWETNHTGESPIADPDLALVDPNTYSPMDAPIIAGKSLPDDLLKSLYHDAAMKLLGARSTA